MTLLLHVCESVVDGYTFSKSERCTSRMRFVLKGLYHERSPRSC
eukprot:SAG31_NODE_3316_length_4425_cov_3.196024_4_plen_44_part_00